MLSAGNSVGASAEILSDILVYVGIFVIMTEDWAH